MEVEFKNTNKLIGIYGYPQDKRKGKKKYMWGMEGEFWISG